MTIRRFIVKNLIANLKQCHQQNTWEKGQSCDIYYWNPQIVQLFKTEKLQVGFIEQSNCALCINQWTCKCIIKNSNKKVQYFEWLQNHRQGVGCENRTWLK